MGWATSRTRWVPSVRNEMIWKSARRHIDYGPGRHRLAAVRHGTMRAPWLTTGPR